MQRRSLVKTFGAIFLLGGIFLYPIMGAFAASNAVINATIKISVCGNNVVEGGEECDGTDLVGQSCTSRGFTGGTLACRADCTFIASQCTTASTGGGGGGGGGSGGGNNTVISASSPLPTAVVLKGTAPSQAIIIILRDGQVIATLAADTSGQFQMTISTFSAGSYILGIYAQDAKGNRSPLLTIPVTLTQAATTTVSDIIIPSLVLSQSDTQRSKGDTNSDGRVNLIDFSIAAYWYRRPAPPQNIDLNGDGTVNIVDLSILAFYWSG